MPGSSPLARGLHRHRPVHSDRRRIIPARAGFTVPASCSARSTPDHPRSRGVYGGGADRVGRGGGGGSGSSPLARGLRLAARRHRRPPRIIPARAGFTRWACHWRTSSAGSSPLARGLLHRARQRVADRGIIPARAGFTRFWPSDLLESEDHPRSRGVYLGASAPSIMLRGSSPLARGLHRRYTRPLCQDRIIPARAGFTLHASTVRGGW